MADEEGVTIIKKNKKVVGGGHHGGAWKVAYADFVTAMMAFFLLMWLLNATTEKQRKGIADYFSPTIPIHSTSGGGDGMFDGKSMFTQEVLATTGTGATDQRPSEQNVAEGDTGFSSESTSESQADKDSAYDSKMITPESDEVDFLQGMLVANSGESSVEDEDMAHIRTRVTDEGLVIEIFDREEAPLFDGLSDTPTPIMDTLIRTIATVMAEVTNDIAIVGHTFYGVQSDDDAVDWYLSSNRAQTARRMLLFNGISETRLDRVTGKADREPAFENRFDRRNNRIEIILLR